MTTTTSTRKITADQVRLNKVMAGWYVWNVRRPGTTTLYLTVSGEKGHWEVSQQHDLAGGRQVVATVASLDQARAVAAALYNDEDPALAQAEAKPRRKGPESVSPVEHGVKVGDFFVASWGWDQTNIDFYEVVALGAKSVKVRQVGVKVVEDHTSQEAVVPVAGAYYGEVETKVLRPYGEKGALSFSSYKSGYYWDGKPKYRTASGWGH